MSKKLIIGSTLSFLILLFGGSTAIAATTDEFAEAKNFINQKISCTELNQDQLEKIGDYIMEQTAPGAAHTQMEQIMGGEGSESLRQAHIFMARRWYCGDATGFGMMGMMVGGYPGTWNQTELYSNRQGMIGTLRNNFGMMNGWNYSASFSGWQMIIYILGVVFFVGGIAAFVKYLIKK